LRRSLKRPAAFLDAFRAAGDGDFSATVELHDGRSIELHGNRLGHDVGVRAWYCRDVTARAGNDPTRSRLVEAIEAITDGFMLYDSSERLVLCNSAFRRLIDVEAATRPGVTLETAIRAGVEAGLFDLRGLRKEQYIREMLTRMRRGLGAREIRLASGRWLRILDRGTSDGGFVAILSDITGLKQRAQDQAAAAARGGGRTGDGPRRGSAGRGDRDAAGILHAVRPG
jgi:PAS domain-containing protein